MAIYTLDATVELSAETFPDDPDEQMISFQCSVLRDDFPIGNFSVRYGIGVSNEEIRDDVIRRAREIILLDWADQQDQAVASRLDAIKQAAENWSIELT
jgi:hypothetical protein